MISICYYIGCKGYVTIKDKIISIETYLFKGDLMLLYDLNDYS